MNEYARSSVYVARYHLMHGGGDLALAQDLMEEVATSNSEEMAQAADLLKRIEAAFSLESIHKSIVADEELWAAQQAPKVGQESG